MNMEARSRLENQLKVLLVLSTLAGLNVILSGCSDPVAEAYESQKTPTVTVTETPLVTITPTSEADNAKPVVKVDNLPIGQIGKDIVFWPDLELQTIDFDLENAPNKELIRELFEFKEVVREYSENHLGRNEDPYQKGIQFGNYLADNLDYLDPVVRGYLEDYYDNNDTEDQDGNDEAVPCMEAQIFAASFRGILPGAPVSVTSHRGAALDLAADMLNQPDGAVAPDIDGTVVRYPDDKFVIELAKSGDTVAIRYGDQGGHVVTILGIAHNQDGELMVLVFDSNRIVTDKLITNGIPQLRWMTEEEFARQNENQSSRSVGIRSNYP